MEITNTYSEILLNIVTDADSLINGSDQAAMDYKASAAKWSKKEILGHLVDSAYNNHQRFMRAEGQGNLVFWGYDQDGWVKKNNYQKRTTEEILRLWVNVNQHLGQLIASLPQSTLNLKTVEHNFDIICMNRLRTKDLTCLSYLIWDYLFHIEYHLTQIIPNYKKKNRAYKNS